MMWRTIPPWTSAATWNLTDGNAGGDTLDGGANIDDLDGGDQDDTINVANNEAEFDTLQDGLGYDQLVNLGANVDVTLNAFNTAYDAWNNGLEEYLGNGARVIGNGGANGLHFGFTKLTNTTGVNSGLGDDGVTTSYDNTSLVVYDGDAGSDQVTLVFTPSQLEALTTADILVVKDYVASPNLKTLSVTNVPAKGNFTATNFETARLAVYDDGLVLDITTCFAQIQTQDQIIRGGAGDNVLTGTPLVDLIFGEMGNDTINGLDAGDCLFGGAGNDLINGDAGADLLSGGSGHDTLNGGVDNDSIFGGSGDDFLTGDTGYDNLQGGAGADTLDGGLHDDILNGGLGVDNISGGEGYDTIQVRESEAEYDTMNGGGNTDTIVNLGAAPVVLNAFTAAANSIEVWQGNGQPIVGNSGANVLNFQISAVASLSLSGVPYIDGGAGDDTITGTNGVDELRGGAGDDTLFGLGGVDTLRGGADNDSLNGGDGVDYLYGDDGADTITTGAGRDLVYFSGDLGSLDTITDFALYSDTINLVAYGVTYAQVTYTIASPTTTINLPNGKKIKLENWARVVASSQFKFL